MDWVEPFYSRQSRWFGPPGIADYDRESAAAIEQFCGPGKKRILELGAGSGGAAAAMADLGHDVLAIELSPVRAANARTLAEQPRAGSVTVLEANFYTASLPERFDLVCYWLGFGVGSDADQRRLLRRVAREWLAPGGCMLLDVYLPWYWSRQAGEEQPFEAVQAVRRRLFDPLRCRFVEEWWPAGHPDERQAQSIRCYTPADFLLLLDGTGLELRAVEIAGERLDPAGEHTNRWDALRDEDSFMAQLALAAPDADSPALG